MPFSAVAVIIRLQSNQGVLVSFCLKYVPGNGVPSNALLMTVYHNIHLAHIDLADILCWV